MSVLSTLSPSKDRHYAIKKITQASSDVVVLDLVDIRGEPVFNFRPGQYVMLSYITSRGARAARHAFSIASSPTQTDVLTLGVKIGGSFTRDLAKLNEGDDVFVSGPYGSFIFDEKKHREAVFIAGGIGVTPFMSALRYAADNRLENKLSLLYSNRTMEGAVFLDDLAHLAARNPRMRVLISITDEENVRLPAAGFINERINARIIDAFTGGVYGKTFFLCGSPGFMKGIQSELLAAGVDQSQIVIEAFSMTGDVGLRAQMKNLSYAMAFSAAIATFAYISITNASTLSAKVQSSLQSSDSRRLVNASSVTAGSLVRTGAGAVQSNVVPASTQAPLPVTSVSGAPVTENAAGSSGSAPMAVALGQSASAKKSVSAPVRASTQVAVATRTAAPAPITSVSSPAAPAGVQSQAQTVSASQAANVATVGTQPASLFAPAPVTSVSAPVSTAAPAQTQPQQTAGITQSPTTPAYVSGQTAPAPVTSVSSPAAASSPAQAAGGIQGSASTQVTGRRYYSDDDGGYDD
ncbi:MAG: FAD-binding oxidoreductase [Candidatus Paceibacterota bacterium]|jgi:ferredoxin-NADP reductase